MWTKTNWLKFYSDTKHRIFPRSANVIGREVRNCHPAKSVHLVEEIIEKFRSGEQDKAEFWINKPEAFIYILYTAVRDEKGNFKGVLEMMQDCTRIRSLEGSHTLLTWDDEVHGNKEESETAAADSAATPITSSTATAAAVTPLRLIQILLTRIKTAKLQLLWGTKLLSKALPSLGTLVFFDLFDQVPGLRQHMPEINSNFAMLNTAFGKIMAKKATIAKAADRSGMIQADLMNAIAQYIEKQA